MSEIEMKQNKNHKHFQQFQEIDSNVQFYQLLFELIIFNERVF
jgi:hypothetical protein